MRRLSYWNELPTHFAEFWNILRCISLKQMTIFWSEQPLNGWLALARDGDAISRKKSKIMIHEKGVMDSWCNARPLKEWRGFVHVGMVFGDATRTLHPRRHCHSSTQRFVFVFFFSFFFFLCFLCEKSHERSWERRAWRGCALNFSSSLSNARTRAGKRARCCRVGRVSGVSLGSQAGDVKPHASNRSGVGGINEREREKEKNTN